LYRLQINWGYKKNEAICLRAFRNKIPTRYVVYMTTAIMWQIQDRCFTSKWVHEQIDHNTTFISGLRCRTMRPALFVL
jgi:hypothetical protein